VGAPVAVYRPVPGVDVDLGARMLTDAGFQVHRLPTASVDGAPRDAVALLVGYDPVDAAVFDAFPKLRIVATHSAGYDMVDVAEARRRGVVVCNLPGGATEEVAVHAFTMALAVLRQLPRWHAYVRGGRWNEDMPHDMRRPSTLRCGVLGMGRIGRRFASLAGVAFGEVLGADPLLPDDAWPSGVARVGVDDLFARADVLSLHLPLSADSAGIVDADRIASMPTGAVLVNTSRGALVDERALLAALDSGHLAGAGLDVVADEPPEPGHPLVNHERTVVTPHVAYLSAQSLADYATWPARNVISWYRTRRAESPVD